MAKRPKYKDLFQQEQARHIFATDRAKAYEAEASRLRSALACFGDTIADELRIRDGAMEFPDGMAKLPHHRWEAVRAWLEVNARVTNDLPTSQFVNLSLGRLRLVRG